MLVRTRGLRASLAAGVSLMTALLLLVACGGGAHLPTAAAFVASPGCRSAAPDLLAIARTARGHEAPERVAAALVSPQRRLQAQSGDPFQPVVTAIGFLRIRVVGDTYDDSLRKDVNTSVMAAIQHCTSSDGSAAATS